MSTYVYYTTDRVRTGRTCRPGTRTRHVDKRNTSTYAHKFDFRSDCLGFFFPLIKIDFFTENRFFDASFFPSLPSLATLPTQHTMNTYNTQRIPTNQNHWVFPRLFTWDRTDLSHCKGLALVRVPPLPCYIQLRNRFPYQARI
jgi:hypothetical protein